MPIHPPTGALTVPTRSDRAIRERSAPRHLPLIPTQPPAAPASVARGSTLPLPDSAERPDTEPRHHWAPPRPSGLRRTPRARASAPTRPTPTAACSADCSQETGFKATAARGCTRAPDTHPRRLPPTTPHRSTAPLRHTIHHPWAADRSMAPAR